VRFIFITTESVRTHPLGIDNAASDRIWDKLGFQRIGLIPGAGRLKSGPNGDEEYVDAVVVYKSFV